MSLVGFKAKNHPQQAAKDWVDDRAVLPEFFAPLHEQYGFTIDAAASAENAVLPRFWTKEDDALSRPWTDERVWCNPPYSDMKSWVAKAWQAISYDCRLIVMLVPANRCEQAWWQDYVERFRDGGPDKRGISLRVQFLRDRMRFKWPAARVVPPKGDRPPFGCALLIWKRGAA